MTDLKTFYVVLRWHILPAWSYAMHWVCVCLNLSQVGVLSNGMDGSSSFLARRLPSTHPSLCYNKNLGIYENKSTSLWNFVLNSGLRNFESRSIVETCFQLSLRNVDTQSILSGQSSSTSWQYLRARPPVYLNDRQALSAVRFRRAGPSATAGTFSQWLQDAKHMNDVKYKQQ